MLFGIFGNKTRLKKSYFKQKKYLQNRNTSIFKLAHHKMQALGLIYSILLSPIVVAASIISHATFLMVANIVYSSYKLFEILYKIYEKIYYKKYHAAFWEFFFSAAIIAGLFMLVFTFAPLIPGSGLISIICFINLFASSINIFVLLRPLLLPLLFSIPKYVARIFGHEIDIELEFAPDFNSEEDDCARRLIIRNYPTHEIKDGCANELMLEPFNQSKTIIYKKINKDSVGWGAIERAGEIEEKKKYYDDMVNKGTISGSHDTFFRNKLLAKAQKIQLLTEALSEVSSIKPSSPEVDKTLRKYFDQYSVQDVQACVAILKSEIVRQADKMDALFACFPLHLFLHRLQDDMKSNLSDGQQKYFASRRVARTVQVGENNLSELSIYRGNSETYRKLSELQENCKDQLYTAKPLC